MSNVIDTTVSVVYICIFGYLTGRAMVARSDSSYRVKPEVASETLPPGGVVDTDVVKELPLKSSVVNESPTDPQEVDGRRGEVGVHWK